MLLSSGLSEDGEHLADLGRLGARLVLQRAVEDAAGWSGPGLWCQRPWTSVRSLTTCWKGAARPACCWTAASCVAPGPTPTATAAHSKAERQRLPRAVRWPVAALRNRIATTIGELTDRLGLGRHAAHTLLRPHWA